MSAFADPHLCRTAERLRIPVLSKPFALERLVEAVHRAARSPSRST